MARALGIGDGLRDVGEPRGLLVREAAGAQPQSADQRAVHDEVGVAADRRGEMRVAAQVSPKWPRFSGRVDGLRLRAQHDLVDEVGDRHRLGALQHAG